MAQEYYNLEKTAEVLGINLAEVQKLREQNEIRGYRDGTNWKFKVEDVEKKLAELIRGRKSVDEEPDDTEDVLLSEVELGGPSPSSGSVIGAEEEAGILASDSDLQLAGGGAASGSDPGVTVAADYFEIDKEATVREEEAAPSGASGRPSDIDLTIDASATVKDSQLEVGKPEKVGSGSGSAIDLNEALDDDNLVLGSGSSGSDITIGGDSGISLVDPSDSGLSLEEPVNLVDAGEESLELGEDDMVVFGSGAGSDAATELGPGEDFLLTPMEDKEAGEDAESGSQVIALDTEGEEAAGGAAAGVAMLEEDFLPVEAPAFGGAAVETAAPAAAQVITPQVALEGAGVAALPEAPYSVWNVLSLTFCVIILALTGMMVFDLLRNMWSWGGTYNVNSSLMDMILNLLP